MSDQTPSPAIAHELTELARIADAENRAYAATQLVDVLQRGVSCVPHVRAGAWVELRVADWTLASIGRHFGVSRARVAQVTGHGCGLTAPWETRRGVRVATRGIGVTGTRTWCSTGNRPCSAT